MAGKSPRLTRHEWQALIQEQADSGLTRESFCKSRNINMHTFCYWQQKLKPIMIPASSVTAPGFIEIKRPPSSELCAQAWDVELSLGKGVTLRLRVS